MDVKKHPLSRQHAWLLIAGTATILCGPASAWAGSNTSVQRGDVYPLKHGIYIMEGSECVQPANAAIRQYDGKGISSAQTHACRAVIRVHTGKTFTVDQTCVDAGAGAAPRFKERQNISVTDERTFSQRVGGNETTYHFCPADQLPAGMTGAAR